MSSCRAGLGPAGSYSGGVRALARESPQFGGVSSPHGGPCGAELDGSPYSHGKRSPVGNPVRRTGRSWLFGYWAEQVRKLYAQAYRDFDKHIEGYVVAGVLNHPDL